MEHDGNAVASTHTAGNAAAVKQVKKTLAERDLTGTRGGSDSIAVNCESTKV